MKCYLDMQINCKHCNSKSKISVGHSLTLYNSNVVSTEVLNKDNVFNNKHNKAYK